MTPEQLKNKISRAFQRYFSITAGHATNLVPSASAAGKVYEAYVLSIVARELVRKEGCQLRLVQGPKVKLKSSPGPVNRAYPYIEVFRGGALLGEIWTDVEFTSLSYWLKPGSAMPTSGDVHELDILFTRPRPALHPHPDQILLGVECKDTPYARRLLREILGVRRELSFIRNPTATAFNVWPRPAVPAFPASCLLVYSSSAAIASFASPGSVFGIDFLHEPT